MFEMLKKVLAPIGPSGMETAVADAIRQEITPYVDEIETDALGNLIAVKHGKGMIIFSPLAQGLLTERYLGGIPEDSRVRTDGRFLNERALSPERLGQISRLNDIAAERGQTLAQMALAWVYAHEGITSVLIGASKPEQIIENLKMTENTSFTKEELDAIDAIVL